MVIGVKLPKQASTLFAKPPKMRDHHSLFYPKKKKKPKTSFSSAITIAGKSNQIKSTNQSINLRDSQQNTPKLQQTAH